MEEEPYSMFRELGNVIEHDLVWVLELVVLLLGGVGLEGSDDLNLSILELGVLSEFLSFLLVGVLVCHPYFKMIKRFFYE